MRSEYRRLTFKAKYRSIDVGFSTENADVIRQITRGKIVGTVHNHVVVSHDLLRIAAQEEQELDQVGNGLLEILFFKRRILSFGSLAKFLHLLVKRHGGKNGQVKDSKTPAQSPGCHFGSQGDTGSDQDAQNRALVLSDSGDEEPLG